MTVVRFDDFYVVPGGQSLRRHLQQLERHVDANAHIGRHHDRDVFCRIRNRGLLVVAEAGGANHRIDTQFTAHREMRESAFGPGEVDQYVGTLQTKAKISGDDYAAVMAHERGSVGTDERAAVDVERAGQFAIGGGAHGLYQHVAHAPASAGNADPAPAVRVHAIKRRV